MARAFLVSTLTLVALTASCASHQGYPGEARAPEELSVLRAGTSRHSSFVAVRSLVIESVSGEPCGTDPCIENTSYVQLLPGEYEVTVYLHRTAKASQRHPFFNGLLPQIYYASKDAYVANEVAEANRQSQREKQVIRVLLEAGRTYAVHYRSDPPEFFLSMRYRFDGPKTHGPMVLPHGRFVPCLESLSYFEDSSSFCTRAGSAAQQSAAADTS